MIAFQRGGSQALEKDFTLCGKTGRRQREDLTSQGSGMHLQLKVF